MAPPPTFDVEHVRSIVAHADSSAPLSPEARAQMLEVLEEYECWGPFFRLLKRGMDDVSSERERNYVRLARVQNVYLEDTFAAAETCAAMVQALRPNFRKFSEELLPHLIEFEDFVAEATILSAIRNELPTVADRVACLERLCMLFEKKTHNDVQLSHTYEQLLSIDANNVKALRYFKLLFTQNNEWDQVVETLTKLLSAVHHPQELFRVAQELAGIYLYQLDMAEAAIAVLDAHCGDSPLDTSTILFDAYQRLGDWPGCLRVLRQCLLTVDSESGRSTLHYKMGGLHMQLGDMDSALDHFIQAAKQSPHALDAIEGIINIGVIRRDWQLIATWLGTLREGVFDERLSAQLKQAQGRLQDGLMHAAKRS